MLTLSFQQKQAIKMAAVSVALRQLCDVYCSDDTADIRINSRNTRKHIHMCKPSKIRHLLHVRSGALNIFSFFHAHTLVGLEYIQLSNQPHNLNQLNSHYRFQRPFQRVILCSSLDVSASTTFEHTNLKDLSFHPFNNITDNNISDKNKEITVHAVVKQAN